MWSVVKAEDHLDKWRGLCDKEACLHQAKIMNRDYPVPPTWPTKNTQFWFATWIWTPPGEPNGSYGNYAIVWLGGPATNELGEVAP